MKKTGLGILLFLTVALLVYLNNHSTIYALNLHAVSEAGPPVVTEEGILFRFKDEDLPPIYVMVSGDFNDWEEPLLMIKNMHDVFVYIYNTKVERAIVLKEGKYRYRYLVDGIWIKDPVNNKTVYDNYGTELSYFEVDTPVILPEKNPVNVKHNKYIFYHKDDAAKNVYIVGDFNNWNPYSHPLRKNISGLWEIEIDIIPGNYAYRFIVDGVFRKDPLGTEIAHDKFDNKFSLIKLPIK